MYIISEGISGKFTRMFQRFGIISEGILGISLSVHYNFHIPVFATISKIIS